jgi:hypothetical protein
MFAQRAKGKAEGRRKDNQWGQMNSFLLSFIISTFSIAALSEGLVKRFCMNRNLVIMKPL